MMSRNAISKTGLIASPKKQNRLQKLKTHELNLSKCAISKPVQYSLRPFGGLFNPYSKACSILCNHPGPNEVKNVVKHVKEQFVDGKCHFLKENLTNRHRSGQLPDPSQIPEEFFCRYTGSDSRPLTPTPTVISGRTRTSTGSHLVQARRCFTPDPIKSTANERKQLIVDLRRSHSQETLFWNASSELSPALKSQETTSKLSKANNATSSKTSLQPKNMRLCEQEARKRSAELKVLQQKEAELRANENTITCINDMNDLNGDDDALRRRGKKKKKLKPTNSKIFNSNQDPETQITTIEPDSPNVSARPAATNTASVPKNASVDTTTSRSNGRSRYAQSSFITEDALKILQRGLNVDIVESAFQKYMSKALQEAFKTIPVDELNGESEALRQFKQTVCVENMDNEKWITMPRKYTRCSARFTLPINTHHLADLSPLDYVSRYVWISEYRKQLYRFVFTKFLSESEAGEEAVSTAGQPEKTDDDSPRTKRLTELSQSTTPTGTENKTIFNFHKERLMEFKHIDAALVDVLGFHGTVDKIDEIKRILLLNCNKYETLNFRSWCGIVAFAERFLNTTPISEDPCDEVELADFESLERKYLYVKVLEPMKFILNFIKD